MPKFYLLFFRRILSGIHYFDIFTTAAYSFELFHKAVLLLALSGKYSQFSLGQKQVSRVLMVL